MANMQQQAKDAYKHGKDIANDFKSDVKDAGQKALNKAQDSVPSNLSERVWGAVDDIKGQLADYRDAGMDYAKQGESLIKKYPFVAVAGAIAVGTIVGGLLFRRSSKNA